MSYNGRIPSGGKADSTGYSNPQDSVDARKIKGEFRSSAGNRSVSAQQGKTHIPPAIGQQPRQRPLDDWEIKIQEHEDVFLKKASDLITSDFTDSQKDHVKQELKALHTNMHKVLSQYNQRVSELRMSQRILEKNAHSVTSAMIRDFMPVKEKLAELEKALEPNASKSSRKELKDVLDIAREQLLLASKTLASSKVLLAESTIVENKVEPLPKPGTKVDTEISEVTEKKKSDSPRKKKAQKSSEASPTVPPEQRLQNLKARLKARPKPGAEEVQELLKGVVVCLEELSAQLGEYIGEQKNEEAIKAGLHNQTLFLRALGRIRKHMDGKITASNISNIREDVGDRIFVCERCLNLITGWVPKKKVSPPSAQTAPPEKLQKDSNSFLRTADITFAPLKEQFEALNKETSPSDRSTALKKMDDYFRTQQARFSKLLPLLEVVTTKCDFEGDSPPPECIEFFTALRQLDHAVSVVHKKNLDENYVNALKTADSALAKLDQFDRKLPDTLWNKLTISGAGNGRATPHFLNLTCRSILNEGTGPLSGREGIQKFENVVQYLRKVQGGKLEENTDAETIQAFQKVVGDGFSSPQKVRALMAQARNVEEVRAVGFQLINWTDIKDQYLDQVCTKLKSVEMDMELPEIHEGREELKMLTEKFTAATLAVAEQQSSVRLARLENAIRESVKHIIKEKIEHPGFLSQLKGDKQLCDDLQRAFNEEFAGVVTVELTPGKAAGDIDRRVVVKLQDTDQVNEKINAVLSSKRQYAVRLREKLLASEASDLLVVQKEGQGCRWEPHPQNMIREFADDFVEGFEKYQQAVDLAQKHAEEIDRLVYARQRADLQLKQVEEAIPAVGQLRIKARKKAKKTLVSKGLEVLTRQVSGLRGISLKRLTEETTRVRDQVVNMVKKQQLHHQEAISLLDPLYTVRQTAKGRTSSELMRAQPLSIEDAKRTEKLADTLKELEKKYRSTSLWHRLTRAKRLRAVETARALVAICEGCPHAPIANAQMLDGFLNELRTFRSSHPDYKKLSEGLREYADHLQNRSASIARDLNRG